MSEQADRIKHKYNRISKHFDKMDKMIKDDWRSELIEELKGDILEVGVGTGANFKYYSEDAHVIGIDFSSSMLEIAQQKAESSNAHIELHEMNVEDLKFEDNSFDYIVSTCVFCSVPDPVKGLKELRRVVKPDGRIVMLEHMRSESELMGKVLDFFNPVSVNLIGANINRKTVSNIYQANLEVLEQDFLMTSIMRKLVLSPNK
ncbi:class I SAM-dependent methyltransferase [Aquisalibacillus elongatus]|uniref:Ubiquinone/menaquinone biosynthesis C-methylase UbiE n=1 Tax=Aquisalibacillus elongatus TaxID=485577 RepID=A0A3N5BJB3_9BACI|nr:class I SAM-dependent methyltransferase [Aquisalibacillus elongatus]RPF55380.1 ubiquinone/menaquinone biosynthesis C-methylase UbiE [Aquisalibacillus elongatus]